MKKLFSLLTLIAACSSTQPSARNKEAVDIVKKYYAAYNAGDAQAEAALMSESVLHESNQGKSTVGRKHYLEFSQSGKDSYKEKCTNIEYFTGANPENVLAESTVVGHYVKSVDGYPKAKNQRYQLRVVESFEVKNGQITRLSTFYNEQDWIRQISAKK
jgi:steroid delta-isomerase-like uncharacterized protein